MSAHTRNVYTADNFIYILYSLFNGLRTCSDGLGSILDTGDVLSLFVFASLARGFPILLIFLKETTLYFIFSAVFLFSILFIFAFTSFLLTLS